MDRISIVTNPEAFKQAFPNKANLVVGSSLVELILLYLNIRHDFNYRPLLKKPVTEFYAKLSDWLGEVVPTAEDTAEITFGTVHSNVTLTLEDAEVIQSILKMNTGFQKELYELHTPGMKYFMRDNGGMMCGNVILHCTDEELAQVINAIDFPFTTISNLLTAIRADLLLDTEQYGRIRTDKDVYLVDMLADPSNCVGVFASQLLRG